MKTRKHLGDSGYTAWLGKGRIQKTDPRIEAVGDVDEAQAAIALCLPLLGGNLADRLSSEVACMRLLMAQLMSPVVVVNSLEFRLESLDEWEKELNGLVPELSHFYEPGSNPVEAQLNFARTVIRRAERHCHLITVDLPSNFWVITAYLNRLSSVLFLLSQVKA